MIILEKTVGFDTPFFEENGTLSCGKWRKITKPAPVLTFNEL